MNNDMMQIRYFHDRTWPLATEYFHNNFEICFSLFEAGNLFINNHIYPLKKGGVYIFNPADIHRSIPAPFNFFEIYTIHFNPEIISSLSTPETDLLACFHQRDENFHPCCLLDAQESKELSNLILKAEQINCTNYPGQGKDIYHKLILGEILLLLYNIFNNKEREIQPIYSNESQRITAIIDYIEKHLTEDLCLDRLAKRFFLDKNYLNYFFKKNSGFSLTEYIINRRILESKNLLLQGNSVQKVSEMVGFNNNSHFIRTFKKLTGIPPKQYVLHHPYKTAKTLIKNTNLNVI